MDKEGTIICPRADKPHTKKVVDLPLIPGCPGQHADNRVQGPAVTRHTGGDSHVVAVMILEATNHDDVGILARPLQYHTPKLPGLGDVDWGKFFSVLSDTGYDGPVCIEVEDRAYEKTLELRKGSLRQSRRLLRGFMPCAKPRG